MTRPVSRRRFLAATAPAGCFLTAQRGSAAGVARSNDRLRFAGIGVGGKGSGDVTHAGQFGDVVALCDVDGDTLGKKAAEFPRAERFADFRKLFDAPVAKQVDAVTVSTPDHTHALAAMLAIRRGIHVSGHKPLTGAVAGAHRLMWAAADKGVCTQMGNQGTAGPGLRRAVELVRAGVIGPVTEVHVWTNRPIWPQAPLVTARPPAVPVPKHLDWDAWLGPAPARPYAEYAEPISAGRRKFTQAYH